MVRTVSATGNNVRNALSAARKLLGVKFRDAAVADICDHDDGLYRVVLTTGDVVEVTVVFHGRAGAQLV